MAKDARGFSIPLNPPFAQIIVLTGSLSFEDAQIGFGTQDPLPLQVQFNLTQLHTSLLETNLAANKTKVTAAVGFASINNSDKWDGWTWAVDNVTHEIKNGELLLNLSVVGQGGNDNGPDPQITFYGDVINQLAYHVTVLTSA